MNSLFLVRNWIIVHMLILLHSKTVPCTGSIVNALSMLYNWPHTCIKTTICDNAWFSDIILSQRPQQCGLLVQSGVPFRHKTSRPFLCPEFAQYEPISELYNKICIGALYTGTETRFTGSRLLIHIQCGLAWAPHGTQTTGCTAGLDLTHYPGALSHSTARSLDPDPDWGSVEAKWSLDPYHRWSALDLDSRSHVESPSHNHTNAGVHEYLSDRSVSKQPCCSTSWTNSTSRAFKLFKNSIGQLQKLCMSNFNWN